jgi:hypothetical protein
LLNVAILDEEIRNAAQLPETWTLSDRQARGIIHIGVSEFLTALANEATQDVNNNARVIIQLISQLTHGTPNTPSNARVIPIQRSAPSIIANGARNSRTAVHMANSLAQQARMLPRAEQVAPSLRPQVAAALEDAIRDAQALLLQFDAAVQERLAVGLSDAV